MDNFKETPMMTRSWEEEHVEVPLNRDFLYSSRDAQSRGPGTALAETLGSG